MERLPFVLRKHYCGPLSFLQLYSKGKPDAIVNLNADERSVGFDHISWVYLLPMTLKKTNPERVNHFLWPHG